MVNTSSKSLHFGRKSWGEFEKPTPEVPILGTVCHLDSICGVFQHFLPIMSYSTAFLSPLVFYKKFKANKSQSIIAPNM